MGKDKKHKKDKDRGRSRKRSGYQQQQLPGVLDPMQMQMVPYGGGGDPYLQNQKLGWPSQKKT